MNIVFKFPIILDILNLIRHLLKLPWFLSTYLKFAWLIIIGNSKYRHKFSILDLYPRLDEHAPNHEIDTHYIYHPAWAARLIKKNNPSLHIDISSTLHFSTLLSAFIPTRFFDLRNLSLNLSNLSSEKADLTNLPFKSGSITSLSCMHVIEHIGLGRYGDQLDPNGDLKAMNELQRVVKKDGFLYIVVPVGEPKIMFNAHRIYSYDQIINIFNKMNLQDFALIPDDPSLGIIYQANKTLVQKQKYGCGCFLFKK